MTPLRDYVCRYNLLSAPWSAPLEITHDMKSRFIAVSVTDTISVQRQNTGQESSQTRHRSKEVTDKRI